MNITISRRPVLGLSLIFTALVLFQSCAPHYMLKPASNHPKTINGIDYETLTTPKCVLQVGSQSSSKEEMLVRVRVTNKSGAAFDLDPTSFSISAPAEMLKSSPLVASDPNAYVRELTSAAETLEARTKMESYQGIEGLTALKGNESSRAIEAARSDFKQKQKDAEKAREEAIALRKRIATLKGLLTRESVKPGEKVEGLIIFKSEFKSDGEVVFESTTRACAGKIKFLLRK